MHVQIINLQLQDMSVEEFHAFSESVAPTFAELPGLISKTWLQNTETNTYGGVYLWESREAMERFLASDLFNAVATHPNFTNATSRDFEVIEAPTRVTRGLPGVPI